jgi:ribosomal protein L37AE/L43A
MTKIKAYKCDMCGRLAEAEKMTIWTLLGFSRPLPFGWWKVKGAHVCPSCETQRCKLTADYRFKEKL